ncbi:hypothetical protein SCHPADRAFT_884671 [Schizopora paradoxa]|uniref:Uncharacterized protein n=1 Tax=Schizopora paradoxa TaxID=27342 RepID=A0A0H2S8R8_9AGAM|nr:hypothetical protein SCHPADRAFT_884671 [Schizopora paradoxa]
MVVAAISNTSNTSFSHGERNQICFRKDPCALERCITLKRFLGYSEDSTHLGTRGAPQDVKFADIIDPLLCRRRVATKATSTRDSSVVTGTGDFIPNGLRPSYGSQRTPVHKAEQDPFSGPPLWTKSSPKFDASLFVDELSQWTCTDAPDNERPKKAIRVGVLQEIPRLQSSKPQELRRPKSASSLHQNLKTSKTTDYAENLLNLRSGVQDSLRPRRNVVVCKRRILNENDILQHFAFRCDPRRMNLASPKDKKTSRGHTKGKTGIQSSLKTPYFEFQPFSSIERSSVADGDATDSSEPFDNGFTKDFDDTTGLIENIKERISYSRHFEMAIKKQPGQEVDDYLQLLRRAKTSQFVGCPGALLNLKEDNSARLLGSRQNAASADFLTKSYRSADRGSTPFAVVHQDLGIVAITLLAYDTKLCQHRLKTWNASPDPLSSTMSLQPDSYPLHYSSCRKPVLGGCECHDAQKFDYMAMVSVTVHPLGKRQSRNLLYRRTTSRRTLAYAHKDDSSFFSTWDRCLRPGHRLTPNGVAKKHYDALKNEQTAILGLTFGRYCLGCDHSYEWKGRSEDDSGNFDANNQPPAHVISVRSGLTSTVRLLLADDSIEGEERWLTQRGFPQRQSIMRSTLKTGLFVAEILLTTGTVRKSKLCRMLRHFTVWKARKSLWNNEKGYTTAKRKQLLVKKELRTC